MIQIIGLIVSAYACTRLLQIPLEQLATHRKESEGAVWLTWVAIAGSSATAIIAIVALTIMLFFSAAK